MSDAVVHLVSDREGGAVKVIGDVRSDRYGGPVSAGWRGFDKWTLGWLLASITFGAGLLVAAVTIPVYNGTVSQTLVQANGTKSIVIVAIPLAGALLVFGTILLRLRHARAGVGAFIWFVIGVLGAFAFLGMLTIGPFVAPVPVCLLMAALRIKESARAGA